MKKQVLFFMLLLTCSLISTEAWAQCAMCTKTASQMGEKPALGMNQGILYLMATPFLIMGYIGYRWWKNQREMEK
jgi:hypothetical protein